jgi:hypothetical protein
MTRLNAAILSVRSYSALFSLVGLLATVAAGAQGYKWG